MSYLDKHLSYMNVEGASIKDQQFNDSASFINSTFADSPFYRVVQVNGQDLEVRLLDVNSITRSNNLHLIQFEIKFMLLKPNTSVDIGDYIEIDNQHWLVVDFTVDNALYPKAKIQQCNNTLHIKTGETKTLQGYDDRNRPVYDTVPTYADVECLVTNYPTNTPLTQPINVPNGRVYIAIKYDDNAKLIKENDVFDLYDRKYKVYGIDFSNVIYGKGLISLVADRVSSDN